MGLPFGRGLWNLHRSPVGKPTICEPRRHQYGCTRVRLLTPFLLDLAQASAGFWVWLGGGFFSHASSVFFLAVFDMATDGNSK
jgi:hypothetical protein